MLVLPQHILQDLGDQPFDALMQIRGDVYRQHQKRETQAITLGGEPYFLKKHTGITIQETLKNFSQGKTPRVGAKSEWESIQKLTELGIPTTPLVGYGVRGHSPFTQESFVLTRSLVHTVSLEDFCKHWAVAPPPLDLKNKLLDEVARITRVLHEHGIFHRDYYLCHFLLQLNDNDELDLQSSLKLHLIDLHRMEMFKRKARWQCKDLASLLFSAMDIGLSRQDMARFVCAYTQLPLREALDKHASLFKQVLHKAEKLYVKAHGHAPKTRVINTGTSLPRTLGHTQCVLELPEGNLQAEKALRVLPTRRWVLKGEYQGSTVVAKVYQRAKDYHRESRGHHALAKAGIQAPGLVYEGKLASGLYCIVYEYIKSAHSPTGLSFDLMKITAQMHDAGLRQHDCHFDNFLCLDDTLYVLDAASIAVTESRSLKESKSLSNLALLFAQCPAVADEKNKVFFKAYCEQRGLPTDDAILQNRFASYVAKHRNYRMKHWLAKIYRNCSLFKSKHRLTKRFVLRRDFATLYSQTLCDYPDAYFHPKSNYLKQGRGTTVVRQTLGDWDLVIKRYNLKNWVKRLKRLFTPSKASKAWRMSHAMAPMGIHTPEPMAYIEERMGPFRLRSYFVTKFTEGERLDHVVQDDLAPDVLANIAQALYALMQALKASSCYHGDLKASNLLWDGEQLCLLDCDAAAFYRKPATFEAMHAKDWARLKRNFDPMHPLYQQLLRLEGEQHD